MWRGSLQMRLRIFTTMASWPPPPRPQEPQRPPLDDQLHQARGPWLDARIRLQHDNGHRHAVLDGPRSAQFGLLVQLCRGYLLVWRHSHRAGHARRALCTRKSEHLDDPGCGAHGLAASGSVIDLRVVATRPCDSVLGVRPVASPERTGHCGCPAPTAPSTDKDRTAGYHVIDRAG